MYNVGQRSLLHVRIRTLYRICICEKTHLVDAKLGAQIVEGHIHGVEDTDNFHGSHAGAHGGEVDYVTEEDADR